MNTTPESGTSSPLLDLAAPELPVIDDSTLWLMQHRAGIDPFSRRLVDPSRRDEVEIAYASYLAADASGRRLSRTSTVCGLSLVFGFFVTVTFSFAIGWWPSVFVFFALVFCMAEFLLLLRNASSRVQRARGEIVELSTAFQDVGLLRGYRVTTTDPDVLWSVASIEALRRSLADRTADLAGTLTRHGHAERASLDAVYAADGALRNLAAQTADPERGEGS